MDLTDGQTDVKVELVMYIFKIIKIRKVKVIAGKVFLHSKLFLYLKVLL